MKKTVLLLCAILTMASGYSQSFSIQRKSTEQIRDRKNIRTFGLELIGKHDGSIYYLHQPQNAVLPKFTAPNTYQISKYDENLKLLKQEPLDVQYQRHRMGFESVILLNGKLWAITSFQNSREKKHLLFARQLNLKTLKPQGSLSLIGELDYSGYSRYRETRIRIEGSDDETKMMVFFTFVTSENAVIKNGIYVYSDDMELQWKTDDKTQAIETEGVFRYQGFSVSNEGTIFVLGRSYPSREASRDNAEMRRGPNFSRETLHSEKPTYTYQLHIYSKDDVRGEVVEMELPSIFIKNLEIKILNNESIVCYGIYSDPGMASAKGGFIYNYNLQTGRITNLQTTEINTAISPPCFNERELQRFHKSIDNPQEWDPFDYELSELMLNSNGDYYFLAEQVLKGTYRSETKERITITPVYYFYDLFLFTMKAESTNLTSLRIPKRQYIITTTRYMSYAVAEYNDHLYIFYNSLARTGAGSSKREQSYGRIARISNNGKIEEKEIPANPKLRHHIMKPRTFAALPDGEVVYAQLRVNYAGYSFEKITIKE